MGVINRDGSLYMATGIDNTGLYNGLNQAEVRIDEFGNYVKRSGERIGALIGAGLGAAGLKAFASEIINVRGEIQMLESSFEVLLGGKGVAGFMDEMKRFAVESPLSMNGVAGAAQTLLGFGISAEKVMPTLRQLGDVSMGNEDRFKSLALAFAQMSATGKLMGQDLMQMINAGFNPLSVISEKTGKSIGDLKKEMESGAITSDMVAEAFAAATAEGGKFYGMTQKQAEGIKGLQAQLEGGIQEAFNELGKSQEGLIAGGYKATISLVENYKEIGKVISVLIATYGSYRAAVALNVAMEKGWTISQLTHYRALLMAEKAQRLLNATMLKNPYVFAAVALTGLVTSLIAFADKASVAEKMQKRLNEETERMNNLAEERKQKADSLVALIKDETEAEVQKIKAFKELQSLYPDIFGSMDIESVKLANEIELKKQRNKQEEIYTKEKYKQLIAEARQRIANSASINGHTLSNMQVREDEEAIKRYQEILADIDRRSWEAATPKDVKKQAILDRIDALKEKNRQLEKRNLVEKDAPGYNPIPTPEATKDSIYAANEEEIKALQAEYEKLGEVQEKATSKNKAYWEQQEKAAKSALDGIDSRIKNLLDAGKTEGIADDIVESYKKAQKDLAEASANLKLYDYSGKQSKDADSAAEKARREAQIIADAQLDLINQEKKAEFDRKQAKIESEEALLSTEKDSASKRLKQLQLNYEKEILEVERYEQQLIEARQNAERKAWEAAGSKGVFSAKTTSKDQLGVEDQTLIADKRNTANLNKTAEMNQLLNSLLGQYQDYAAKRKDIEEKFTDDVNSLNELRTKENSKEIDNAIKEAKRLKEESLSSLDLEQLQKDIDWTLIFGNLEEVSTEQLNLLKNKLQDFVSSIGDKMTPENLKTVMDALRQMDDQLRSRSPLISLSESFEVYKKSSEDVSAAQKKLNDLLKEGKENTEEYKKAEENLTSAQRRRHKALADSSKSLNEIGRQGRDVAQSAGDILNAVRSLGFDVSEEVEGALAGVDTMLKGLESIDLTKPMSIITGAISVVSGFIQTIGSSFGLGKENKEVLRAMERYREMIDVLDTLIDKQTTLLSQLSGEAATKQFQKTTDLIKQQVEYEQEYLKNWFRSGATSNHHSMGYRFNRDNKDILRQMGVSQISDVLSWDAERWNSFMNNYYSSWAKLPEEVRNYAQSVIDAEEATESLKDTLNEIATGVSFDSFKNGMIDDLLDIDATAEDVAGNIEKYFQKAMIKSLLDDKYNDQIKALYNRFAEANSDNNITEAEYAELQQAKKELADAITKERNLIAETFDWASQASDNSLKGAFSKASQESIDLLSGQFSAIRIDTGLLRADTSSIRESLAAMGEFWGSILKEARDIKGLISDIKEQNKKISENTGYINSIAESLKYFETHQLNLG